MVTETRTWEQICTELNRDADNVGRQYRRIFPDRKWRKKNVPTADEYAALIDGESEAGPAKIPAPRPNPETKTKPIPSPNPAGKARRAAFVFPTAAAFRWTMISVCIAHSVLIAYGLKTLFPHGEGLIAGCLAFLVIVGCLIVAHAPELPRTSNGAAWLATIVYVGAWFVHVQAFQKESPGANAVFVGWLSVFIVGMAAASLWLVRDSKIV